MSYLDGIAAEIAENVPDDLRPTGDVDGLFRLYAVLVLVKGGATTTSDVHDAWCAWMQASDPNHRSLRPFAELDPEIQAADEPYVAAIHAAARSALTVR